MPQQSINMAKQFVEDGQKAIVVTIVDAQGSTPRDAGSWMVITLKNQIGTIGGGQLEWMVAGRAREFINEASRKAASQSIPLGPEINQCCGGRVTIKYQWLDQDLMDEFLEREKGCLMPKVQIHGAGHTGIALAKALALLPVDITIIDVRTEQIDGLDLPVKSQLLPLPEQAVRNSDENTAFIILTHSHDLDFLITAEALARKDAAYVGMIGSKTKRAVFKKWLINNGYDAHLVQNLVCPIGIGEGYKVEDKRPEVIAALTAGQIAQTFFG